MSTASEKGMTVLTAVITLLTLVLLLSPSGPIGARISEWRTARNTAKQVREAWPAMDSIAQRIHGRERAISIVEFSDYECPYCRANHEAVEEWAARHPDREVGLVHMPLSSHPAADGAARAALCADEADEGPAMHRLLITSEGWRSDTNWIALAEAIGISNLSQFKDCLQSGRITDRLARGAELAAQLGISGTPAFVSVTRRANGQQSVEQLEELN